MRTDFILSAEIMAIALNELGELSRGEQAAALALVAFAVTFGVYGAVALIVKLDDIGLHMAQRGSAAAKAVGTFLVRMVPGLLKSLATIGTAAMLWVGGGILLHGLADLGFAGIPKPRGTRSRHRRAHRPARARGRVDRQTPSPRQSPAASSAGSSS